MSESSFTAFNHPHCSGAVWITPLRASLCTIDASTMYRIVKVVLKCLAYLVLGIPALIGMHLNQRSMDRVENVCATFRAKLNELNRVFNGAFEGHNSYVIDFKYDQKSTYSQGKHVCIHMKRGLSDKKIEQFVEEVRQFSYRGLFIDVIGIEACNQFDQNNLEVGYFQQSTFAKVTLYVPDQFQLKGQPQQVITVS